MNISLGYTERAQLPLERLSSWWKCWGRSDDVGELSQLIAESDSQLVNTIKKFDLAQSDLKTLNQDFFELTEAKSAIQDSFNALQISHGQLKLEYEVQSQVLREERAVLDAMQTSLKTLERKLANLNEEKNTIQHSFNQLCSSHANLKNEYETQSQLLERERSAFTTLQTSHVFLKNVLGAREDYLPKYDNFQRLFYDDFMAFANSENFFDREADAVLQLQSVADEVRLLSRFPVFREKTIVAIAGGFSSGKSSLLTSFFDEKSVVRLPIGIEPVTAIPTYIVSAEHSVITGFAAHGGSIAISSELYAQMGHRFVESLEFDLRRILPFIALETQWTERLDHLCFIDTPGYNPPAIGTTVSDNSATAETLQQADAVLWVISIDANGEISHSDIEYLLEHIPLKPLGIVINKADLRPLAQVMEVMTQITETLDSRGIEYVGISAYSSVEKRELAFEKTSLREMLQIWNTPSQRVDRLIADVKQVFELYKDAFQHEIIRRKNFANLIKNQLLDLHELGVLDEQNEDTKLDQQTATNINDRQSIRAQKVRNDLSQRLKDMAEQADLLILNKLLDTATHIEEAMMEVLKDEW